MFLTLKFAVVFLCVCLCVGLAAASQAQASAELELQVLRVKPSEADPAVRNFDEPNLILVPRQAAPGAPLAVFLPGTGGRPENVRLLLGVIAGQGYRVIGLEYNDEPAVVQVCPRRPEAECSGKFRQQRVFGNADSPPVGNIVDESIVRRLVMLLRHLARQQPAAQWESYLDGDEPRWSRLVVSGLSQGAGMAAYIAKQRRVARVVLFSSPWDFYGPRRSLAPWMSEPSETPPERWFAEFHRREMTAPLIVQAYRLLGVPDAQVRIFDLEAPEGARGPNPFHSSTVRLPDYAPDWQWLYGSAAELK
jgi:hypothetical protein